MSLYQRRWVICDAPGCERERLENDHAPWSGWTRTGLGDDLCPEHSANLPEHPHTDVVDVKALAAGDDT